jgi:hypothetical protein
MILYILVVVDAALAAALREARRVTLAGAMLALAGALVIAGAFVLAGPGAHLMGLAAFMAVRALEALRGSRRAAGEAFLAGVILTGNLLLRGLPPHPERAAAGLALALLGYALILRGVALARPSPAMGARRASSAPGRRGAAVPTWRPLSGKGPERPFPAKAQWARGR